MVLRPPTRPPQTCERLRQRSCLGKSSSYACGGSLSPSQSSAFPGLDNLLLLLYFFTPTRDQYSHNLCFYNPRSICDCIISSRSSILQHQDVFTTANQDYGHRPSQDQASDHARRHERGSWPKASRSSHECWRSRCHRWCKSPCTNLPCIPSDTSLRLATPQTCSANRSRNSSHTSMTSRLPSVSTFSCHKSAAARERQTTTTQKASSTSSSTSSSTVAPDYSSQQLVSHHRQSLTNYTR